MNIPEQRGLFSDIAVSVIETPKQVRAKLAKKAFEKSNKDWREAYRAFILQYAEIVPEFIAEDCRKAFQKTKGMPKLQVSDYRASGRIYQQLLAENKLRRVGFGWSTDRSVWMPKFSKV